VVVRSFIAEVRAEAPPPKRRRATGLVFRCATIVFAVASLILDARLAFGAAGDDAAFELLLRTVLVELEVYLAVVVAIMTFRILAARREPR
jgi:hypothetical protein